MRDSLYNPFMPSRPQIVYGGGGGGQPAAVAPTVNTANVQHTGIGANHVGGTSGGKAGGNPFGGTPQIPQNQIQFGGYGQQSPFGMTNPASWGGTGTQWGTGGVQTASNQWTPGTNTFNPNEFAQSQQSVGGGGSSTTSTQAQTQAHNPQQSGSALSMGEHARLSDAATNGDQQAAGTLYNNNLANVDASGGASTTGLFGSIRGHGDQAGSSLGSGTQSNVGLQDHAIALGENMPGLIGVGTNAINNALNIAPQDPNQRDNRTAQEVSIARHTNNWAEQAPDTPIELTEYSGPTINNDNGPSHQEILDQHAALRERNRELGFNQTPEESAAAAGFDMNDPSTWVSNSDSRERTSDNDGGSSGGSSGGK